jgi:hypothetical protein
MPQLIYAFIIIVTLFQFGCSVQRQETEKQYIFINAPEKVHFDIYKVKEGETLRSISVNFGIPQGILKVFNQITRSNDFNRLSTIKVPFYTNVYPIVTLQQQSIAQESLTGALGIYKRRLVFPVLGGEISSLYGFRRKGLRFFSKKSFHKGIDIRSPEGTPFFSAHDGNVIFSGKQNGYGNTIIIKGNAIMTVYAHNARNLVVKGDRVAKGDQIGEVGRTGNASGSHVHFEVKLINKDGVYSNIDPVLLFSR